jgi:hypothetical protein
MRKFKTLLFQGNCRDGCKENLILRAKKTLLYLLWHDKLNEEQINTYLTEIKFYLTRSLKSKSYEGTEASILELQNIFDNALSIACCLQQPPHSTSRKEAKQYNKHIKDMKKELNDNIKDIVMALTGKAKL